MIHFYSESKKCCLTLISSDELTCLINFTALKSFHVIKLCKCSPVSFFHVIKVALCVEIPIDLIWAALIFASKGQNKYVKNMQFVIIKNFNLLLLVSRLLQFPLKDRPERSPHSLVLDNAV